jgi:hypothetical protein
VQREGSSTKTKRAKRWSLLLLHPQHRNFEAQCRLSKLYIVVAVVVIGFLEGTYGPGATKMLSFS